MAIRYIFNDPASIPFAEEIVEPLTARSGRLAKFALTHQITEQIYDPDSLEFAVWQSRDTALRTVALWERLSGTPLRSWYQSQGSIQLNPQGAQTLEAKYDRNGLLFGCWPATEPSFFVASSADAVSHEVGHAILDALRPSLWDSFRPEVAAFHEGFADCVALLSALHEYPVINTLLSLVGDPKEVLAALESPVAQVAESIALQVKMAFGRQHPASLPRQMRHNLQWAVPTTLPPNPTATNLSREPHSFGRIFSGCFYDCIDNIYRAGNDFSAEGLQRAAEIGGKLLARAVATVVEETRFFRAVGRAMIHADNELNEGLNHVAIRDAFLAHNIALGSSMLLSPSAVLSGPAPKLAGKESGQINPATRKDLLKHSGAPKGARVSAQVTTIGGKRVLRANVQSKIDVRMAGLAGAQTMVKLNDEILVSKEKGNGLLLGELPSRTVTEEEINAFVLALQESNSFEDSELSRTHKLVKRQGRYEIERVRFSCHCGSASHRR